VTRRALAGFEQELEPGLFMDVSLCVSELVTSAVVAAQPIPAATLELRLSLRDGLLTASVQDHERGGDGGKGSSRERDEELGPYIISRLADRWGVDPGGARRWLEFSGVGVDGRERSPAFGHDQGL